MSEKSTSIAADLGLLALRATVGGLMAGHGAQKLFGAFGGHGLEGTSGWLESMGLKPGKAWAFAAGASEFGSGVLTALGALGPVGPISVYGPMIMAWSKAHAGKPIWVTSGGAELPLMYISASTALALTGPGRFSVDKLLKLKVPAPLVGLTVAGVAAGVAAGLLSGRQPAQAEATTGGDHVHVGQDALDSGESTSGTPIETGIMSEGGIGHSIDPQDALEAREVGGDPPGSFAPDMRGPHLPDEPSNPNTL